MVLSARAKVLVIAAAVGALVAGYTIGAYARFAPFPATAYAPNAEKAAQATVLYSLDRKQNDRALIALIDNAHTYVYFAIYTFTLPDVAGALICAKERGVDVRGIVDKKNSTTSYEAPLIAKLRAAGIPLETQTHPTGIMHLKVLVTENAYASGSYNWTRSATQINDEVLEIGTNPTLRARYTDIVKQILAANASGALGKTGGAARTPPTSPQGVYSYTEAPHHIGETASIKGTIVAVYRAKSGTTFFDYCVNYRGCPFSAVIFSGDQKNFSHPSRYQGKTIIISGPITSYNGRAEIVLHDPSQITE